MAGGSDKGSELVLETDRLLLRPWRVSEAPIQREMWTERDPRVPPHRRIDAEGRPAVTDFAEAIRSATEASWAVLRWATTAGYRRLWATVWEWNTASRRVLAKVGFAETERQETPHGTNCVTTRQL